MVIWFIGMSAAGKSHLASKVYKIIKEQAPNTVLLDGDVIREVFGNDTDHSIEGRAKNAKRLSHLTKFLDDQGINVIAAVLSIFPEWQDWNRENLTCYNQIYVKVPFEILQKREFKGLYSKALKGEIKNVVGVDIEFPTPVNNDIIFDNSDDREDFTLFINEVLSLPGVKDIMEKKRGR